MRFDDVEALDKDEKIKTVVNHLARRFGEEAFKIQDHWDADLVAIGLVDREEKYLVYISAYADDGYFVALENLIPLGDFPYEPAGDFDNMDLEEVEKVFAQHLRL